MLHPVTVVICAAGLGTRLGRNLPKCLVEVGNEPILARQLQQLPDLMTVVVVAGYKSELVAKLVRERRPQTIVALNHDFASTGTAHSLRLGSRVAAGEVLTLDGDLLVSTGDLLRMIEAPTPCLGITTAVTEEPVWAEVSSDGATVTSLSQREASDWEWSGLAKLERSTVSKLGSGHVFPGLRELLPAPALRVDCVEIDTPDDLYRAEGWLRENNAA